MEHVLNTILTHLREELGEGYFLDIDIGQLQIESPPVSFPCALVAIPNVNYQTMAGGKQKADAEVEVTLGFSVLGPSDINTNATLREKNMEHYAAIKKISDALNNYGGVSFNPLRRKTLASNRDTYPRTYALSFTTQWLEG